MREEKLSSRYAIAELRKGGWSDEEIIDLGPSVDLLPLARRPKAIDMTDMEALVISYDAAAGILRSHGFPLWLVDPVTIGTSLMDMSIGVLIAFRRTAAFGLIAGIVASLGYMAGVQTVRLDAVTVAHDGDRADRDRRGPRQRREDRRGAGRAGTRARGGGNLARGLDRVERTQRDDARRAFFVLRSRAPASPAGRRARPPGPACRWREPGR